MTEVELSLPAGHIRLGGGIAWVGPEWPDSCEDGRHAVEWALDGPDSECHRCVRCGHPSVCVVCGSRATKAAPGWCHDCAERLQYETADMRFDYIADGKVISDEAREYFVDRLMRATGHPADHVEVERVFDELSAYPGRPLPPHGMTVAKWGGSCGACSQRYEPGEEICPPRRGGAERWVHRGCA
jgi:hypothetical protein